MVALLSGLFNTKVAEAQAESVIHHLDDGCGVRTTARLVYVSQDTVARLLRMVGRHAERFYDQQVRDVTPRALEVDEQWSFVKKSRSIVRRRSMPRQGICRGYVGPYPQSLDSKLLLSLVVGKRMSYFSDNA